MSVATLVVVLGLLTSLSDFAEAISCIQDEGGVSFISHNNTYCSVIVDLPNFTPSRKFGIISGQTDQEEYYEGFFAIESDRYSIPLACWLEKFDFGPDGMLRSTPAELMFRCVCKTDFCNYYAPKASFQQFVTGMEPQIQF